MTAAPPRCSVAPTPSTAAHAQAQSSSAQTPSTPFLAPLTAAPTESMVAPTPSTGAAAHQAQSTSAPAAPTGSTAALAPSTTANGAKPSRHRHHKRDKNYITKMTSLLKASRPWSQELVGGGNRGGSGRITANLDPLARASDRQQKNLREVAPRRSRWSQRGK